MPGGGGFACIEAVRSLAQRVQYTPAGAVSRTTRWPRCPGIPVRLDIASCAGGSRVHHPRASTSPAQIRRRPRVCRVRQTCCQQCRLRSSTSPLLKRARARQNRHAIVDGQRAGGNGNTVQVREKTRGTPAARGDLTEVGHERVEARHRSPSRRRRPYGNQHEADPGRAYPPAIAPTIISGSLPEATAAGSAASGESCDRSSPHA